MPSRTHSMRTRVDPFYIFVAIRILVANAAWNAPPSFPPVQIRIPSFDDGVVETNVTQTFPRQCKNHRAYLLTSTVTSSWHVFVGEGSENGVIRHQYLERVSHQSRMHHCDYAMNAGPFHKDGSPVGWLISQGRVISKETNTTSVTSYAGFGKTWDGYYYIGVPPIEEEEDDEPSVLLQDFVTGFGWLVYQGKSVFEDPYNDTDDNPTGADRAPRSAIGIDSHGKVLWLIVDGCQFCLHNQGPTLRELADILVEYQAEYAVNMDGGSSSELVQGGTVLSRPTCLDLPFVCERPVASIFCIQTNEISSY